MALQELSAEYRKSAELLRERLAQLRQLLKNSHDPEEIWHLKRQIAELAPMLTQMNELADLTAHYYERGYWRNERYSSNCFRDGEYPTAKAIGDPDADSSRGMYGSPAGYVLPVSPQRRNTNTHRKGTRRKQKHRLQKLETSGAQGHADYEIPAIADASFLGKFFPSEPSG